MAIAAVKVLRSLLIASPGPARRDRDLVAQWCPFARFLVFVSY